MNKDRFLDALKRLGSFLTRDQEQEEQEQQEVQEPVTDICPKCGEPARFKLVNYTLQCTKCGSFVAKDKIDPDAIKNTTEEENV